jgi:chitin synthase
VTGAGNDKPTCVIVKDLLGIDEAHQPPVRMYHALGESGSQLNFAQVFSGHLSMQALAVPFVLVVKVGGHREKYRPGNRGKRDSQLILMQLLSKSHARAPMSPLELELCFHFAYSIGVEPSAYEYLLWVDGDTEIMPGALSSLVASMSRDTSIAGLCGETLLRNEDQSIVTMVQV